MLCESCKEREATVHLTQVADGAVKKLHLCEGCAAKQGFDAKEPLSMTDLLLGMGMGKSKEEPEVERACPRCHMRRTDFKKTGRFGCASCYEAFAEELPPLLKAMHRSDQHTGKIPKREGARVTVGAELSALQRKMDKAIAAEKFEEAATLRDRINECRKRLEDAESESRGKS